MNFYKLFRSVVFSALALTATTASAGNQGVYFYYGLGLGGASLEYDFDPNKINLGLIYALIGIEEDGWGLEFRKKSFYDTDTKDSEAGQSIELAYRTLDNGGLYYKVKYGRMELGDSATSPDGILYGVGIGYRLRKDHRVELEYVYSNQEYSDQTIAYKADVHMLMLTYIFDGAP